MKKFASIHDFKEKSILYSKQIVGGNVSNEGDRCTNEGTKTYTNVMGWDDDNITKVWSDNDTEQKCDPG